MPTFNEVVKGLADKQTYERIQGVVHAGLEDIHNHAVKIQSLQSKPGMEGLIALAFPKLTALAERIENEDRKETGFGPEHRDAPSKVNGSIPQGVRGVRYPYSQKYRSGISSVDPSEATKALYRAFEANESDRREESARS
jgi:hypothetical protein